MSPNDPQIPMTPEVVALLTTQNTDDIAELKRSHQILAQSMHDLVGEVRMAKWVLGLAWGVGQPVVAGLVLYYLTHS